MKKILVFLLVLVAGIALSENTLIAVVNNTPISLHSVKDSFLSAKTKEEKSEILNAEIDFTLQLQKVSEFNLSTPFDLSTSSYAGDGESCILNSGNTTTGPVNRVFGLKFSKDGMMMGPNIEATTELAQQTNIPVIASGGVSSLEHIKQLADQKIISGVICGRALYEEAFTYSDVLEILKK